MASSLLNLSKYIEPMSKLKIRRLVRAPSCPTHMFQKVLWNRATVMDSCLGLFLPETQGRTSQRREGETRCKESKTHDTENT